MARILIVDDDHDLLKMMNRSLSFAGHMVFTAPDAIEAMELLRSTMFDLLISDANMPHFSGFDLIQTVKSDVRFRHLAICMLTALSDKKNIDRALRIGVDDYLIKPIDPLLLEKKISMLFDKRPPAHHPEVRVPKDLSAARVKMNIEILEVSELAIKIKTPWKNEEGSMMELDADFLNTLSHEIPFLKVLSCHPREDFYVSTLSFVGAQEKFLQKVRAWIYSHGSLRREA